MSVHEFINIRLGLDTSAKRVTRPTYSKIIKWLTFPYVSKLKHSIHQVVGRHVVLSGYYPYSNN